jgi:hypothetical protein
MSRWQSMTIARDEGTDQCSLATAVALRAPSAAKEHLIAISPVNDVMALLGVNDVVALEIRSLPLPVPQWFHFNLNPPFV